jgi:DNA-binding CsgD family transcriptional regulator
MSTWNNRAKNYYDALSDDGSSSGELLGIIKKKVSSVYAVNRLAPITYVADNVRRRYLLFNGSSRQLLGYDAEFMVKAGPQYYVNLLHHNDYKIYQEKICPEARDFLRQHNDGNCSDYSFSVNYRIKGKDGNYLNLLQRVIYIALADYNVPMIELGFLTDITHYKEDTRMIHVIEKADYHRNILSTVQLMKSVYFPDKLDKMLSNRECEILKGISEGLSSKEIASKLFISVNTIHNHRKNMLQKTHTGNTAELLKYALSNYLL